MSSRFSVLDFSEFRSSSPQAAEKIGREIFEAFRDVGFIYLKNFGIADDLIEEAFKWHKKFFSLSEELKAKVPHPVEPWWHRGYSHMGKEKVSQATDAAGFAASSAVPDVKETYDMGREDDPTLPNIWLSEEDLPGFRDFFNRFYGLCYKVELDILRALSLGMGLEEGFFERFHKDADNQIRLNHYPPVQESILRQGSKERLGAHSDFNTITILFQDNVGGLEIENPSKPGEYIPAPCIPNTAIINVGDFLMMWSNDILKSTMHRVGPPPLTGNVDEQGERMTAERFSIPYFCGADKNAVIECVPGCYGPDRPKRYEPVTSIEYINMRLAAITG